MARLQLVGVVAEALSETVLLAIEHQQHAIILSVNGVGGVR